MNIPDPVIATRELTTSLGIYGWSHLDPILLASLATGYPLLLIGTHGTAKTILVEKLSTALCLSFRHYNASLINYDDLVGIPIPEEGNDQLRFITTPGAIWNAEFVFFDEISRCRPDLQNKLFPIIHEKRIVGMNLSLLQHRWAAMNPPAPNDPSADINPNEFYLGSEILDMALVDRFPFIVPVPRWKDITREDRKRLVTQTMLGNADIPLSEWVESCVDLIPQVEAENATWVGEYIVCVMDLLEKANLGQSPRRAWMLARMITAIHAARLVVGGESIHIEDSAEMALVYGMPQTAMEVPPSESSVVGIHKQAWEIVNHLKDEHWRALLEETDAIKRVLLADDLGFNDSDMAELITQALASDPSESRKIGLATAIFLAFQQHRLLTPAAWEPLSQLAGRVLLPRQRELSPMNGSNDIGIFNEIKEWSIPRREQGFLGRLETNFVLGGYPELWRHCNWRESVALFAQDLKTFGIKE